MDNHVKCFVVAVCESATGVVPGNITLPLVQCCYSYGF